MIKCYPVSVVESAEEQRGKPCAYKRIRFVVSFNTFIGIPKCFEKFCVITQPAFTLDKIEEHATIEQLKRIVMRPRFITCLLKQVFLQDVERHSVVAEEGTRNCLYVKGSVKHVLNR